MYIHHTCTNITQRYTTFCTKKNIWVKRPGTGNFKASDYEKLLGKKVTKNINNGDLISFKHFK